MTDPYPGLVARPVAREDLDCLTPLFDQYRQFYGYATDVTLARQFLAQRFEREDSVLFLARSAEQTLGFAQCYPGQSSLECRPCWLLSDLFVLPEVRQRGVAQALLERVRQAAVAADCCLVELFTARDNVPAQRLYEAEGYALDRTFLHYELML